MEDSILKLITIGYALGIAIVGVMAYLGIKGTNEAIDFQNSKRLEKSFNRGKQLEFQFKEQSLSYNHVPRIYALGTCTTRARKIDKSMWAGPTLKKIKINLVQITKKITYIYEGSQFVPSSNCLQKGPTTSCAKVIHRH